MNKSLKKLEDFINYIGEKSKNSGQKFEELCTILLKEMGFTKIYKRKGQEEGRDIDAEYDGKSWFFEVKRYKNSIDTKETAYKLLQIDKLKYNGV